MLFRSFYVIDDPTAKHYAIIGAPILHQWGMAMARDEDGQSTLILGDVICYPNPEGEFIPYNLRLDVFNHVDEGDASLLDTHDDATG